LNENTSKRQFFKEFSSKTLKGKVQAYKKGGDGIKDLGMHETRILPEFSSDRHSRKIIPRWQGKV
jgi:hypothetical protein